jgi:4-hydroxy-tetrahydrodipicolinate synthase
MLAPTHAPGLPEAADSTAFTACPDMPRFDGLWLPLITPLRQGRVDLDAAISLERHYRDAGIDGLVLFGSTGEGNLLSLSEKLEMAQAIASEPGSLPFIIGAGGVDTSGVAASIRRLDRLAPLAYLVPPPYYLCPSQEGMIWHYRQIGWATERPIILYNVPKRTGACLTVESMEILANTSRIAAVKECNPAVLRAVNSRQRLPGLCGDDAALLAHVTQGGTGSIPASAHIRPDLFIAVMRLARAGQHERAAEVFEPLKPLIRLLFSEPNPAPIKKALALAGMVNDELRMPMTPASRTLAGRLQRVIERLPAAPDLRGV